MEKVCQSYLEGVHWVITYYKKGVPDLKLYYPYDYAPPATEIINYISKFVFPKYNRNTYALLPFQQLLCVLPPKSAKLLPEPLNKLITDDDSPIKDFYPEKFEIDLAGKKNDWQGIVILPIISPEIIVNEYAKFSEKLNEFDKRRNIFGKSFIYSFDKDKSITFNSYYGTIFNCRVKNKFINL
jgi:5'-3' exonuclease